MKVFLRVLEKNNDRIDVVEFNEFLRNCFCVYSRYQGFTTICPIEALSRFKVYSADTMQKFAAAQTVLDQAKREYKKTVKDIWETLPAVNPAECLEMVGIKENDAEK